MKKSLLILEALFLIVTMMTTSCWQDTSSPTLTKTPYPGNHGITTTKIERQPGESGMSVNSLMVKMTIDDLVRQSQAIITGKVFDIFPSREITEGPFGKMIVTDVVVEVERYLYGKSQSAYVGVQVWGGRIADKAMWVEDQPVFNLGEKAALFLASIPYSSMPPDGIKPADYYMVTGAMQGKLGYKDGAMITYEGKSTAISEVEQKIASKQGDRR